MPAMVTIRRRPRPTRHPSTLTLWRPAPGALHEGGIPPPGERATVLARPGGHRAPPQALRTPRVAGEALPKRATEGLDHRESEGMVLLGTQRAHHAAQPNGAAPSGPAPNPCHARDPTVARGTGEGPSPHAGGMPPLRHPSQDGTRPQSPCQTTHTAPFPGIPSGPLPVWVPTMGT